MSLFDDVKDENGWMDEAIARSEFGGGWVLFVRRWTFLHAFCKKVDFFCVLFERKWTSLHGHCGRKAILS